MRSAHGAYAITSCGDVMAVQAHGPWNAECIKQFAKDYREVRAIYENKRWADIVSHIGESLFVPDAEAVLKAAITAVAQEGLCHVAIVIGRSTARSLTKSQLKKMYGKTGVEFDFFDTESEAVVWLSENGYAVDQSKLEEHLAKVPVTP
jgi:hypothetical protein